MGIKLFPQETILNIVVYFENNCFAYKNISNNDKVAMQNAIVQKTAS